MEHLPPDAILEKGEALLELLRQQGLRVSPSCRLAEYVRQMQCMKAAAADPKAANARKLDVPLFAQALLEIQVLDLIMRGLTQRPPAPGWQRRVQQILGGSAKPQEQVAFSPARDLQFELMLAASFRLVGYDVSLEEPDVVLKSVLPWIGFAAKRPRSVETVQPNLEQASDQISRSRIPGVIALDLSLLMSPKNLPVTIGEPRNTEKRIIDTVDGFVHENYGLIANVIDQRWVFGLLVYGSVLLQHPDRWVSTYRRLSVANLAPLYDRRVVALRVATHKLGSIYGSA